MDPVSITGICLALISILVAVAPPSRWIASQFKKGKKEVNPSSVSTTSSLKTADESGPLVPTVLRGNAYQS